MIMQLGIVGIGAGAAAALLFASVTSGTLLSIPLFYLAPLPIMIAGLGWSHWAALIAALAAALALSIAFGAVFFLAFLAGTGAPAWLLTYLTMLARPAIATGNNASLQADAHAGPASLEWYPPGRLVVWTAILATLIVIAAVPHFGFDAESFRDGLRGALTSLLQIQTDTAADASKSQHFLDFLVQVVPPASAVLATVINLINLWLAARVVKFSGRLSRPWPQLSAMTFPSTVFILLAVAMVLSLLGGLIGIIAGVLLASLLIGYGVLGFAVMHDVTRGMSARPFLLGALYIAVLVFGWPMLVLCLLGLSEAAFGLRARVARKRGSSLPY